MIVYLVLLVSIPYGSYHVDSVWKNYEEAKNHKIVLEHNHSQAPVAVIVKDYLLRGEKQ